MVRIGLATDSMEFTPTPAYRADNGYDYSFENGNPFSDIVEEGSFSVSQGFSYGADSRTTTFKCSMSGTMAQMKAMEQYSHIAVYKDGGLVFCGCNPTFSKKIPRGVGRDGKGESFVEASVTYEDYSAGFKDVAFSTDESFDLFYSSNDAIKVCDPDEPSKSLVHILFGYLDSNKAFTLHFGTMPSILKTTVVTYFAASYDDKVLSMLSDVLKQAGLAYYVSNRDIYILDVLETLSGEAVNIPDIESGATKKGRSYVKLEIPEIRMATARIAEDMTVYDSGTMTLDAKAFSWSDPVYYPSKEKYVEASFSCARKEDGARNGKDSDEREKRYFNFKERNFYGNKGSVFGEPYGAFLDSFSRSSSGLEYRVRNTSLLKRDWRLRQNADVLLFKYSNAYRPKDADGNDVWNGKSEDCDYIFSQDMAQRYADALMYQKRTEAVYYEFYADVTEDFPLGYPINSVVSLQGTDEDNPLLLITSRTDRLDPFGGYEYRAVPYDRKGVTLSESFVASSEALPASDEGLSMSLSREMVECFPNGVPKDSTAIRITVTIENRLFTPTLEVAGKTVELTKVTEKVSTGDDTYEYVDTDDWTYDLDPDLGGFDVCRIVATAGSQSVVRTASKVYEGTSVEIQYALGRSMDTPPLEDSQCYWNAVAMYWGSTRIVWRDWTEAVPVPKDGEYLWMRVKVGDGPWRYSRLTGEHGVDGQDAKVFSIGCDHTAVERNDRLEGAVVYKFTIVVQGYENANPQLTVNGEDKTDELEFDEDTGAFFYLFIMEKRRAIPITAILYDGTTEMDRIELQVVDSTMQEAYIGVRDEAPSRFDETQSLLKGDWYVLKSTNVLYIWNGTQWEEKTVDSPGDFSYLSKVSTAMTDMIKIGTTDKTTATILGVFKYLAADQGFIKFLSVYNLLIDNPDGMSVDIRSRDEFGVPLAKPVFDVKFKTKSVFRIDPATGNVYMGSGFFYQAADESIRSSSGKVVIDSNGELIAKNSRFQKSVFEGSLDCKVIKTALYNTSSQTVNVTTIAISQADELASALHNMGCDEDSFYECTVSTFPRIRYFKISTPATKIGSVTKFGITITIRTVYHACITFYNESLEEVYLQNYTEGTRTYNYSGLDSDVSVNISPGSIASYYVFTRNSLTGDSIQQKGLYLKEGFVLTLITGGNALILDIPSSSLNLSRGQVYSDGGTLKIVQ